MGLFKKKENKSSCATTRNTETGKTEHAQTPCGARIKILGSGCAKCRQLEARTLEALTQLGMDTAVEHVTDFAQIAAYGVMTTPALVMDEKVLSFGTLLTTEEIIILLKKER